MSHSGSCSHLLHQLLLKLLYLALTFCLLSKSNERQDYFGQTVNIASRVQGLAMSRSILATAPVVDNPRSAGVLGSNGKKLLAQSHPLRGIASEVAVYEIP